MTTTEQPFDLEKFQQRIDRALRLAEGAATEQEREAANEMAQKLMQKHSIDLAMIEAARGAAAAVEVVTSEEFIFLGTLGDYFRQIAWAIVQSHDSARGVQSDRKVRVRDEATGEFMYVGKGSKRRVKTRHEFVLEITAFGGDLDQIRFLITSIRLQTTNGLEYYTKHVRPNEIMWESSDGDKYRDRRQWLISYADGLRANLRERNRKATEEFVTERAQETSTETALVRQSVALAVRSRRESVNDWMDKKYGGRLRKARGGNVAGGSGSASTNGFSSGRSANVSGAGSKAPRAIGR